MVQQRSGLHWAGLTTALSVAAGLLLLAAGHAPAAAGDAFVTTPAKVGGNNAVAEPRWKSGRATVFWVGESETEDNDHIANHKSAWDAKWVEHFGGTDDPDDRCEFVPCGFKPKENSFYVALPYDDMEEDGRRKAVNTFIPWDKPGAKQSLLKNRWIAIRANNVTLLCAVAGRRSVRERRCGLRLRRRIPAEKQQREGAGIDLSPAVRDCLGVGA